MQDRQWHPGRDEESDDAIRAADADRDATAELLRKHHTDGRLTDEEFQQRLEQSMSARTLGELRALVADLPAADRPKRERRAEWHRPRLGARLLPVFIALAFFGAAWRYAAWHGGGPRFGFPWPLILLAIVGFALLRGRARCGAGYHGRTWRM
jgi:Domain of unknown function (DUF1707)